MEVKQVQRKAEIKDIRMQIKTTRSISKWMGKNNISPTYLFNVAAQELIDKEEKK